MNKAVNSLTVCELNHVAVYVRDLDTSVRFYGAVLGLPSLRRPDFGFGGAWFALGSQELHLITADSTLQSEGLPFHFALQVEDAYAAADLLRERGVTGFRGPAPRPDGAVQIFLEDPDGYVIELVSFPVGAAETIG